MRKATIALMMALCGLLPARPQSPGGVPGCEAWFVTSPLTSDRNGSHAWLDMSGDSVLLRHAGGAAEGTRVSQGRDAVQTFNFHPSLRFSPSTGFMDAVLRHSRLSQATVVGVFCPDSLPQADTRLYAVAGTDTTAVTRDKVLHPGDTTPLDYSPDLLHGGDRAKALKVVCWQRAARPAHSPWGEAPGSTLSLGGGALSSHPTLAAAGVGNAFSDADVTSRGNVVDIAAHSSGVPFLSIGPTTSSDLHYGFTCPVRDAEFFVGTARQDSTECSEGYSFAGGKVYKVVWGQREAAPFLSDVRGHDIDIYKWGDHLHMQVDGAGSAAYDITVPLDALTPSPVWDDEGEASSSASGGHAVTRHVDNNRQPGYKCRGLVKPAAGTSLRGLRVDGFNDTGTYAELSYSIAGGGEFKPHRLGRTYLLAKGGGGTRAYRCTGFDPERKKVIFHNLALSDGDTVTFAWNDGLLAGVGAEQASCGGCDGKVAMRVHGAGPGISYLFFETAGKKASAMPVPMPDAQGPALSWTGAPYPESTRDHTLSGIAPGTYHLSIYQAETRNLRSWSASGGDYATATLPAGSNDISWKYDGSGNEYTAGIRVSGTAVRFGVKLRNDTAWFVRNGATSSPRRLQRGDSIRVRYSGGKVYVKVNATQVSNSATKNSNWRFRASFGRGANTLLGISGTGPSPTLSSDRVMLESVKADTLRYEIHIGSACDGQDTYVVPLDGDDGPDLRSPRRPGAGTAGAQGTLEAAPDPAAPLTITAALPPDAGSGTVQMLVFDVSGKLHRKGRTMNGPPYRDSFTVDAPGVYVVKAVTAHGEYTAKVACGT